jgi:hypothetical protein
LGDESPIARELLHAIIHTIGDVDVALPIERHTVWLGRLPGTPRTHPATAIREAAQVVAPATGLWRPAVAVEQEVAAGEPIAHVTAPCAGMVLYHLTALAVHEREPLVNLVSRQSAVGGRQ